MRQRVSLTFSILDGARTVERPAVTPRWRTASLCSGVIETLHAASAEVPVAFLLKDVGTIHRTPCGRSPGSVSSESRRRLRLPLPRKPTEASTICGSYSRSNRFLGSESPAPQPPLIRLSFPTRSRKFSPVDDLNCAVLVHFLLNLMGDAVLAV